jgi:hypothetical protein
MASPPVIVYRSDDFTRWGAGAGTNLTAAQVDGNFWSLRQAIAALQTSGSPSDLVSVSSSGGQLTFLRADGSKLGPISLPVARLSWRGPWTPATAYNALDILTVSGIGPGTDGLYLVQEDHTSAASFSASAVDASGNPLYYQMFAYPTQPFSVAISVGGPFANMTADPWDGSYELCNVMMPVPVTFPSGLTTSPAPACEIPPASSVVLTLQQIHAGGAITLGSINFAAGSQAGSFSFTGDVTIPAGDSLRLYAATSVDAAMSGFAGVIVGSR